MEKEEIISALEAEEKEYERLCVAADSCYTQSTSGGRRQMSNNAEEACMRSAYRLQELKELLAEAN